MQYLRFFVALTAILMGVAANFWGFLQMSRYTISALSWISLRPIVWMLIFGIIIVELVARWMNATRLSAVPVVFCIIAVVTGNTWPLLVVIWFGLASYALGLAILSLVNGKNSTESEIKIFLFGAGTYGTVVGLLAHFPINYPGVYGLGLAIPVVLGRRALNVTIRSLSRRLGRQPINNMSKWHDFVTAQIALIYFLVALMPEVGHDALAMHLFIPGHMLTRQEWGFDVETYVWAVMPMMGDWLYSIVYMLGGETTARLMNVGFIFVLSLLVRDLVLWAGGGTSGARWGSLLFLTTPLVFTEASTLFIDSIWASFVVAGSMSVFKLTEPTLDQLAHLRVGGFLLGTALASKAVTLTILPVLLALSVMYFRFWGHRRLIASLAIGVILCLGVGSIPYVTAWYVSGNPVFPFFNQIFESPFYPAINFDAAPFFGKGMSWDILYRATFHTEQFLESRPGGAGFQWLLLFPASCALALLGKRRNAGLLLIVASLSVALTFKSVTYLRYILPSYAWAAAGIGAVLSPTHLETALSRGVLPVVGWIVVCLNLIFFRSGTSYGDISAGALMSQTGRESYLDKRLPIRNMVGLLNQLNRERTPVAVFSLPLAAGLASDALYPNWYNYRFQETIAKSTTSDAFAKVLLAIGVEYCILDNNWGTEQKRQIIIGATTKIVERGSISVRKIDERYLFQEELLRNPDFLSPNGWKLAAGMRYNNKGELAVSVSSAASQVIPVVGGHRYRNSVIAKCKDQPTQGRVQVNWLDRKSKFISSDIRVFDCSSEDVSYEMNVTAPHSASTAVVYATGHTSIPIVVRQVSFKQ